MHIRNMLGMVALASLLAGGCTNLDANMQGSLDLGIVTLGSNLTLHAEEPKAPPPQPDIVWYQPLFPPGFPNLRH